MKDISKHYGILTPQERLILTVEAQARGDTEERGTLAVTCPKKSYLMNDYKYSMACSRLIDFALLNWGSSYQALARANLARGAFAVTGREEMLAAYAYHTVSQLSLQEAWKRFCESIGLDGDKVFATFGLDVADLQRQPIDEHLVADVEAVAVLVEDMTRTWAEST